MDHRKQLGSKGEQCIADFMNQQGATLEACNWRGISGELDLIFLYDTTLIFIEVRSVQSTWLDRSSLAVSPKKQRQVARCADEYIRKRCSKLPAYQGIRFDVAGVLWNHSKEPHIDYIADAFESPWAF